MTVMSRLRAPGRRAGAGLLLACLAQALPAAAQTPPPTAGRVVAIVTTLEGTVRMSGVQVELRVAADGTVIARTVSDGAGHVVFADVPPGRYVIEASRLGFVSRASAPFVVQAGEAAEVLLDIQLTFAMPAVEVRAEMPSPTDSVQPVSMSDMLAGSVLDIAPLDGDDFQSLLPLLPGVVRGNDGRLRVKGGEPTQGALQVSSASLIDPSSGDFDLQLPGQSIDSVEVLANPFAAEYGRFSSSITQIRTRRGTNDWEIKPGNLVPRFRKFFSGIRGFEPRFSVRGPLVRDRAFLAQDTQFRYVATPIKSLAGEPEVALTSFDSFTRFDFVLSVRHSLGGGLIAFPRQVEHATMSTFRPQPVTRGLHAEGRLHGTRRSVRHRPGHRAREHAVRPPLRGGDQCRGRFAHGLRPADTERQLLQRPGAQRRQLPVGRGAQHHPRPLAWAARLQDGDRPAAIVL